MVPHDVARFGALDEPKSMPSSCTLEPFNDINRTIITPATSNQHCKTARKSARKRGSKV